MKRIPSTRQTKIVKTSVAIALLTFSSIATEAQKAATVKESVKVFKTYNFSDPNPIPEMGKIYPYYRFDGYTDEGVPKEWKIVELENEYIKLMILPEIGGKIWGAWDKATGKPFIYYNQVVKFRDVAMRGPWTSGGIEANYGIIGHTPNCATPVDYMTEMKEDGSVSCYIGTLDLLTRTYWTIEVNLPKDKAYFTTRSFWNNPTPIEQAYYTWMNVGMPSKGNLQFIYPGSHYIGHEGEAARWNINENNGKDISFYENNNFGRSKSYHIIGKYSGFFGAYYHDEDFGMARYSLRDEKPGRKIWIWGLSRQGMIWEDLLTDTDGQYVEVQSGRLFNQASPGSNKTPFKQMGFAPYTADEWTEYWFPVKGIKGFVKANPYGALNLRANGSSVKIDFLPVQRLSADIEVSDHGQVIYSKKVDLQVLQPFSDTFAFQGDADDLVVTVDGTLMRYSNDPRDGVLSRPLSTPEDFDWNSAYGHSILGREFLQQRMYTQAAEHLQKSLESDPHFVPALSDMAMLSYINLDYADALEYARRALSIDTYDPAANFYYGLANDKLGNIVDAKDGFDIAALSPSWRGAAYSELGSIYLRENNLEQAAHYARKSLGLNSGNTPAWQTLALIARLRNSKDEAKAALAELRRITPLSHFIRFEEYRWDPSDANRRKFTENIRNEMREETFLEMADWYLSIGQLEESKEILLLLPENPIALYRLAFLANRTKSDDSMHYIEKANQISPALTFPFRASTAEALNWVIGQTSHWKPKYYLALVKWSRNNTDEAKALFQACGDPDFAPFYAARAALFDNENYASDVRRAATLDAREWRYGKILADHYIAKRKYGDALAVAQDYHKRFSDDFRISMLLAKTLLLNGKYKAATDLLNKTTILPYEGATDGRAMWREGWLMQAVDHIATRNFKSARNAIDHAKRWPEQLGAGKPYDEDIDLRLEYYLEGVIFDRTSQKDKARERYEAIVANKKFSRKQVNGLVTALALRKLGRESEGTQLLKEWKDSEPENEIAQWAYAIYTNPQQPPTSNGDTNFRVVVDMVEKGVL